MLCSEAKNLKKKMLLSGVNDRSHPKGDQSWVFTGRTDAEAETPILWPPDCEEMTHWKGP